VGFQSLCASLDPDLKAALASVQAAQGRDVPEFFNSLCTTRFQQLCHPLAYVEHQIRF